MQSMKDLGAYSTSLLGCFLSSVAAKPGELGLAKKDPTGVEVVTRSPLLREFRSFRSSHNASITCEEECCVKDVKRTMP